MNALNKLTEPAYALMRIVTGYLFIWHGSQKFFDFPKAFQGDLGPLMMAGGAIELVGGALVVVGLFTRYAAFLCSGTMAVAYWMFHAPQGNIPFPIINGGELAVIYTFVFLYIACRGAGIWSVDGSRR